jgi:hypothetical protein
MGERAEKAMSNEGQMEEMRRDRISEASQLESVHKTQWASHRKAAAASAFAVEGSLTDITGLPQDSELSRKVASQHCRRSTKSDREKSWRGGGEVQGRRIHARGIPVVNNV